MKSFTLYFTALLVALSVNILTAQNINWNSAPQTGFVFQITNNEAQKILTTSGSDTIINSLLHTQIDTFNVSKGWTNRPAKGHFILTRIIENKIHCEYTSVFPYQVLLLKEYNALSLQVLDLEGNVRQDAKVKFKRRRIRFDHESKTYRLENDLFNKPSKNVTVELDGFRSVFNIVKHGVPSWSNNYNYNEAPDFYSYMITDKNKYKPGERVRFKSYALSGTRYPIRKDLELWLIKASGRLKVGVVSPHRPGSFTGEVQLHDSLKLTLDRDYTLQLLDKNRRVVANCSFKYEDYELHGNKLQLDLETSTHFHPATNSVKITATNENGLRLKDARATITVLTQNIREVFQPLVVLPDTLIHKEIELDGDEATVVEIPSSLFQKSNASYKVQVSVINIENQRMEEEVFASHYFSQYELKATFSNDSLVYQMLNNGSVMYNTPVKLYRDGAIEGVNIILPHKEKINPTTATINLQSDLASRTFRMEDMLPKIKFLGGIQKDSFNISIDNPQRMQVSWYIYQGSVLLKKEFGAEIDFKSKIEDRSQTYYVELLYSFGGSDHITDKEFRFHEGSLDISLNLPERVYPGQKVEATIEVTNEEGDAVSGVDLIAMATTAKLDYYLPDLPYYGSTSDARSEQATYSKYDLNKRTAILDLNYNKWVTRLRLDTMKYYQFTYPQKKNFYHQVNITDSTQFAPFVMEGGVARKVYVVEVDRMPVYYSWTNNPKGYSFYVTPEKKKQITLRLHDRVLILDSMCFDAGKKTIFSIDLDHLPEGVSARNISQQYINNGMRWNYATGFTSTEINRLNKYLAAFKGTSYAAYLTSGKEFVPITYANSGERNVVVGPISPGNQTYTEHNHLVTTYKHSGKFLYSFEDNIVYKMEPPELIPNQLSNRYFRPMTCINDVTVNKALLLLLKPYVPEKWHPRVIDLVDYASRVNVLLPNEEAKSGVASLLFQNVKTGVVVESSCRSHTTPGYFTLPFGLHHVIVLYNNGNYLKMDSIHLHLHTKVVVDMHYQTLHISDSTSKAWLEVVSNCSGANITASRTGRVERLHIEHNAIGNVLGRVFDETNAPMPGVSILVKGTTDGTTTDVDGNFMLDIPEDPSILIISFIGYVSEEIEVKAGSEISIVMTPDFESLSEVMVVAYGTASRENSTDSFDSGLQGLAAGVSVQSMGSGTRENEKPETERKDEQVKLEAEQKLYQELLMLKDIRSQFSDVGFWEPRLFTDRYGKSKFTVTFPDDLTRWNAVVYGMNTRLQTGTARKSIKSYKPLMTELHVPQFLTVGDSADFIGKVLNYTTDKTIQGKTKWTSATTLENDLTFNSYHTEKLPVIVASSDSITASYSFTRNDGYLDGEKRKVPVVEQGTLRANGTLTMLKNSDELHVQPKKGTAVKMEIFDNQLDLYTGDVRYLLNYEYACNEQLASKLIGLLNNKLLAQYEGKAFEYDKHVNKIIQRLLKNQNSEFLWSWWDVSPGTSYWMSAHILRALKFAKDAGYSVNLNVVNVTRKATYKYEYLKELSIYDVQIIHALAMWNAKINYASYVNDLDKKIRYSDSTARAVKKLYKTTYHSLFNEKLLLMEIRQLQNLPVVRDSLLRYKKETILNEVYFTDGQLRRYWYTEDLSSNTIAYRIIKRDSTLKDLTIAMQMYFLSKRREGDWNTYEASNVLMNILPDLIAQGITKKTPATVSLKGKMNENIQKFPFKIQLTEDEELHIRKENGLPLYCMQYTEERVTKAQSGTDAFKIKTTFNESLLKAGKPTTLTTTVEVKRDSKLEYVMVEIPIPGGCSYASKSQFNYPIETHREYFKEKTVIFCENMAAGTYVFQVQLLPRFTGKYHVNPAQVSLMYTPVINANTNMEKVSIIE